MRLNSSNIFRMRATLSTESSTGFRPMTASPQPRDRPSITGRDDAIGIIGGVVGLQTGGEGAGQTDGGVAVGGHAHLLGGVDEVQVAHQLTHAGNDLRGQAAGGRRIMSGVVWVSSSHSRNSATVIFLYSLKMVSLTESWMIRVTSSSS